MNVNPLGMGLVVAAMAVESLAQLCLKLGAGGGASRLRPALRTLATRVMSEHGTAPWLAMGVGAYFGEIVLYTLALRFLDISVAFPLGSLCFVGVAVLGRLALGEVVGLTRGFGVAAILAGIWLIIH